MQRPLVLARCFLRAAAVQPCRRATCFAASTPSLQPSPPPSWWGPVALCRHSPCPLPLCRCCPPRPPHAQVATVHTSVHADAHVAPAARACAPLPPARCGRCSALPSPPVSLLSPASPLRPWPRRPARIPRPSPCSSRPLRQLRNPPRAVLAVSPPVPRAQPRAPLPLPRRLLPRPARSRPPRKRGCFGRPPSTRAERGPGWSGGELRVQLPVPWPRPQTWDSYGRSLSTVQLAPRGARMHCRDSAWRGMLGVPCGRRRCGRDAVERCARAAWGGARRCALGARSLSRGRRPARRRRRCSYLSMSACDSYSSRFLARLCALLPACLQQLRA